MLTLEQALAILERMEAAAPPTTAARLADIAGLLQSLSHDNEYLVGLYGEALILPVAARNDTASAPAPEPPSEDGARRPDVMLAEMDLFYVRMDDRLRPSLETIQQANDALAESLLGHVAPEDEARIQEVSIQANVALRLLDGMRQIIALKCGLQEVAPLVFSPAQLMRQAARQMQDRVALRQQHFDVIFPPEELQAVGDFQQTLVILLDLLDNAVHYTPSGGTIQLWAEDLGSHVLFTVQDNGIGLRASDLPWIGQPFWRAIDQPLVADHPGTGMRLYLAGEILRLQQGELIFSGDPEVGSTFSFTLPGLG